ncbi:hypothetical protein IPZ70_07495 [Streptomyces polychromogenes]|nr:hypothetical protein [Streptomyces polychromogenes]
MPMTVVRRRRGVFPRLRKRMRNSFLFVPFAGLLIGWVLATVVIRADSLIHDLDARWSGVAGPAGGGRPHHGGDPVARGVRPPAGPAGDRLNPGPRKPSRNATFPWSSA